MELRDENKEMVVLGNLATFVLIMAYIIICMVAVGYWTFGTFSNQDKDRSSIPENDEGFDQGDLL